MPTSWQYRSEIVRVEDVELTLDVFGQGGWEAWYIEPIAPVTLPRGTQGPKAKVFFKRPVEAAPVPI